MNVDEQSAPKSNFNNPIIHILHKLKEGDTMLAILLDSITAVLTAIAAIVFQLTAVEIFGTYYLTALEKGRDPLRQMSKSLPVSMRLGCCGHVLVMNPEPSHDLALCRLSDIDKHPALQQRRRQYCDRREVSIAHHLIPPVSGRQLPEAIVQEPASASLAPARSSALLLADEMEEAVAPGCLVWE